MSYAIIRNAKYKAANLQGISRHDERQNSEYGNKDIDTSRSHENYHLRKPKEKSYEKEFYRLREENNLKGNLRLTGKKQSNVACEFLITSDNDFFKSIGDTETKRFFESAYDFACRRCGEKNIISAVVHMDESTPHMHLTYIPVVKKKDKSGDLTERINCSEFWKGFNSYGILQDSFHSFITERGFNLERGERSEDPREHLTVTEYKLKTAAEMLAEKETEAKEIITAAKNTVAENLNKMHEDINAEKQRAAAEAAETVQNASLEAAKIEAGIKYAKDELKRLETQLGAYRGAFDSANEIENLGKKSMVGGKVTFTAEEAGKLKQQAIAYWAAKGKADKLEIALAHSNKIADRVRPLKDENRSLKKELQEARESNEAIKEVIRSRPELHKAYNDAVQEESLRRSQEYRQRDQYRNSNTKNKDFYLDR